MTKKVRRENRTANARAMFVQMMRQRRDVSLVSLRPLAGFAVVVRRASLLRILELHVDEADSARRVPPRCRDLTTLPCNLA